MMAGGVGSGTPGSGLGEKERKEMISSAKDQGEPDRHPEKRRKAAY